MTRVESGVRKIPEEDALRYAGVAPTTADQQKRVLFEQWALSQKDYIYTACFYLTRQREDAEDLFQETYLRAFRFFHQFTPGTNCRAWLLTIMHNTFRTRVTQYRRERLAADAGFAAYEHERPPLRDGNAHTDDPSVTILARSFDSEIRDALRLLPEEHRLVLLLVDIEEMTYEETAAVLVCPLGTVRSRLSRARQALRERLTSYAREHGYLRGRRPEEKRDE
jgi:RNA polymerase sigma-70 factor (ECF subfamily)